MEYNETINVYDDKTVSGDEIYLGEATWDDVPTATVFTYSTMRELIFGCETFTNKAWIEETDQYDTATIEVCGLYWAYTPGFWKNHTSSSPSGKDAWPYTGFTTGQLLIEVGFDLGDLAGDYPKGSGDPFIEKTLLDALRFKGGSGTTGALEILLRAGVASFLNATFHENLDTLDHPAAVAVDHDEDPLTPDVLMSCDPADATCTDPITYFPLTSQGVLDAVNAAIASGDAVEMLMLAAELDSYNNGIEEFDWDWPY